MSLDVSLTKVMPCSVFDLNITHNLGEMADKAGIYKHLWRPEELGITTANQLIEPLQEGLAKLESDPAYYKQFNPENGWGSYEGLIAFVKKYLEACHRYPDSTINVDR